MPGTSLITTELITTDWKKLFFTVEGMLSPRLEEMTRSEAFLDTVAVVNGISRVTKSTVRGVGTTVLEGLGLPSGRQLARLQRSLDATAHDSAVERGES